MAWLLDKSKLLAIRFDVRGFSFFVQAFFTLFRNGSGACAGIFLKKKLKLEDKNSMLLYYVSL